MTTGGFAVGITGGKVGITGRFVGITGGKVGVTGGNGCSVGRCSVNINK